MSKYCFLDFVSCYYNWNFEFTWWCFSEYVTNCLQYGATIENKLRDLKLFKKFFHLLHRSINVSCAVIFQNLHTCEFFSKEVYLFIWAFCRFTPKNCLRHILSMKHEICSLIYFSLLKCLIMSRSKHSNAHTSLYEFHSTSQ